MKDVLSVLGILSGFLMLFGALLVLRIVRTANVLQRLGVERGHPLFWTHFWNAWKV